MKLYVVSQWDRFDHSSYGSKYFLSQERAMQYYENSRKDQPMSYWDWDEIETEDNLVGTLEG